jgi:peptidoglycan-associated lipoprotein
MVTFRSLSSLMFFVALAACGSTPPAQRAMTASADNGTRNDGSPSQKGMETPQQASSSGTLQISDEIRKACAIDRGDAFFPFDSSRLQNRDVTVLNTVARCFTTGPLKGRGMRLVGHADPRGPSEYNVTLGMSRADSVASYLQRQGVAASQTETTSRGAMDATGSNEASWAQDRRVDVMLGR